MKELTNFEMVKEFYRVFGNKPEPTALTIPDEVTLQLRWRLIHEEFQELFEEVSNHGKWDNNIHLNKLAKEAADLLYVVYGLFSATGIDADKVFAEVHRSNMSKLDKDGNVVRREDGKVIKSDQYSPADIEKVLNG